METIIISAAIILILWIIFHRLKIYCRRRAELKRQQVLEQYKNRRVEYYRQERQKILNHYRERVASGKMSLADALKDTSLLLSFNSGGEQTWQQEYADFKQEMEQHS